MTKVLVVSRVIPASREEVFAAWLDPEGMAEWMRPGPTTRTSVELDPRVGGKFRIVMYQGDRGEEHVGEYLAIEPPSRLQFTWISAHTHGQRTIVTVELAEHPEGTEVTLTHRSLPESELENHRGGWSDILRLLSAT